MKNYIPVISMTAGVKLNRHNDENYLNSQLCDLYVCPLYADIDKYVDTRPINEFYRPRIKPVWVKNQYNSHTLVYHYNLNTVDFTRRVRDDNL